MDVKEVTRKIAKEGYGRGVFNHSEFERDYNVFNTVRKMIVRFLATGKLNDKLLVNNTVIVLNVFGVERTNAIFRLLLNDVEFSVIKAVLMFLNHVDYSISPDVSPNRVISDLLRDVAVRYNLGHIEQ